MTTLRTMHRPLPDHLAAVRATMQRLGAPTIRVVDCGAHLMALEGVHRLAACAALGLAPILDILAPEALVKAQTLDWVGLDEDTPYTAGELAAEAGSWWDTGAYTLEADGTLVTP